MKKMAIVPWSDEFKNDQLFNLNNNKLNRDNCLKIYSDMKKHLFEYGWEVHTIDCYDDLIQLDSVIFFHFDKKAYKNVRENGKTDNLIYVAFEPPVVDLNHSKKGIGILLKYFHYILTWDDALVDNKRIFKYMLPYEFDVQFSQNPFEKRKLLVNISGNKISSHEKELYSEREKIISFFDNDPEFELYGTNWNEKEHPSYMGLADNKKDVYHRFKFALCLENMWDIDGYITEKILDCFCAGIVPIYLGAKNVNEYIPDNCYIHYSINQDLEKLKEYLVNMKEEEYKVFLENINKYLNWSDKCIYSYRYFSDVLIKLSNKKDNDFVSKQNMLPLTFFVFKNKIFNKITIATKKMRKVFRMI